MLYYSILVNSILLIFSVQHWRKLVFETCLMSLLEMKTTRMPNPVQMPFWQQPTSWECCHNSAGPLKTRKYLKPSIACDKKKTKGCSVIKTLKMENLITFLTLIFYHWFYHWPFEKLLMLKTGSHSLWQKVKGFVCAFSQATSLCLISIVKAAVMSLNTCINVLPISSNNNIIKFTQYPDNIADISICY